jgi:hypothetical protein
MKESYHHVIFYGNAINLKLPRPTFLTVIFLIVELLPLYVSLYWRRLCLLQFSNNVSEREGGEKEREHS